MRRTRWRRTLAASSVLVVGLSGAAGASPGQIDKSFGDDGRVITPGVGGGASDVVLDGEDRLVAVGFQGDEGYAFGPLDMVVTRYLSNGDPDPSFDEDGIALIEAWDLSKANAIALQPDGKIIVVGTATVSGNIGIGIARLDESGSLDPSFSDDGVARLDFGPEADTAEAVTITDSGSILVAGRTEAVAGQIDFAVAAYTSDGDLDPTFSNDGLTTINIAFGDVAHDVSVLDSGKIIVGGSTQKTGRGFAAVRLLSNGTLDQTFGGGDGKVAVGAPSGSAGAMVVQPDGKIVLAGGVPPRTASTGGYNIAVIRLRRGGTLDPTFGTNGRVRTDVNGGADGANDVIVLPSGKLVIAGFAEKSGSSRRTFAVVRYRSTGKLDDSFAKGGIARTALSLDDLADALVRQSDGRLVVVGDAKGTIGLVRYLA